MHNNPTPVAHAGPTETALFVTCLTDSFFPRVGEAIVRLLRHYGCRVRFPVEQTCCGQPAFNSGFHAAAAELIQRMITAFEPYECVVTPSASCAAMVKIHGPELLANSPAWRTGAQRLAKKTWEISTFLRDQLHVDVAAILKFNEPVTFHYPCHARETYSVADLQSTLGAGHNGHVRTPERPDLCCGFGGLFAVDYPELSTAMLDDKLAQIEATGARLVVCNEAACALQMSGRAHRRGLPLRFKHVAECLAESLGLLEPQP